MRRKATSACAMSAATSVIRLSWMQNQENQYQAKVYSLCHGIWHVCVLSIATLRYIMP
jgi:hypothetical protein